MWKKLFDFKLSKRMMVAKLILIVGLAAAIVIVFLGLREIINVPRMKEVLAVGKPLMGDVLLYLVKRYVGWAALITVAVTACYYGMRGAERKQVA